MKRRRSPLHIHCQTNKWKKVGLIFKIFVEGKDLFPAYGLKIDGKPRSRMKEILAILAVHRTAHVIASWFVSTNKTPMYK